MTLITRIADKAGTFGSIVPALGLGFLQDYMDLSISRLMPLFAAPAMHCIRPADHVLDSQCKNQTLIGDYACTGR
ncbi:hypothetical protein [Rhodoferax ferrireducens]